MQYHLIPSITGEIHIFCSGKNILSVAKKNCRIYDSNLKKTQTNFSTSSAIELHSINNNLIPNYQSFFRRAGRPEQSHESVHSRPYAKVKTQSKGV